MSSAAWDDPSLPLHQRVSAFLTAATGSNEVMARRCYISAFAEDPAGDYDPNTRARMWAGAPAAQYLQRPLDRNVHEHDNIYLVVSVFKPGEDGRVRRRQSLCERTLFIMIDDVGLGPSAKVDPDAVLLPPTWSVETSPDNRQLWYRIDPPVTDPELVNRVVDALIRRGLAKDNDPGMKGVTRYGRLPFGVNSKAKYRANGHPNGYPVRLVQHDFERSYTIEQFAATWGITEALPAPVKPTPLLPLAGYPGVAEFNAELLERLELLDCGPYPKPGTIGVFQMKCCPFSEKHTPGAGTDGAAVFLIGAEADGNIYERGAFKCHHGHGAVNDRWPQLLERLKLTEEFRALEAAAVFSPVDIGAVKEESKEIGDGEEPGSHERDVLRTRLPPTMSLEDMLRRFVLIESTGMIADLQRPKLTMSRQTFHDVLAHNTVVQVRNGPRGPQPVEVPTTKVWARSPLKQLAFTITFHPGAPAFCRATEEGSGYDALNLWRPPEAHEPPADWAQRAQRFTDHVDYLVPTPDERERFLDWLAHMEQRPAERPHSHWLMIATQTGIGRSYLGSLLARVAPGHVALNFRLVQSLATGFNGRLSAKILAVVDELNEGGNVGERWAHSEVLKSLLTEEHLNVNPKYGMERTEINCLRFLAFSNHVTALPLDSTDRRWWVIRNPSEPRDQAYYSALYGELQDAGFICSVREWLRRRDISRFNPFERPQLNTAKQELISASSTEDEERLVELIESYPHDFLPSGDLMAKVFGETVAFNLSSRPTEAGRLMARVRYMLDRHGGGAYHKAIKVDGRLIRVSILRNYDRWRSVGAHDIRDRLVSWGLVRGDDDVLE